MSVQVSDQVVAPELVQRKPTGLRNRVFSDNRAFPVPFSERKALLVLGDALLVVLAVYGAFLLWQRTNNIDLEVIPQVRPQWYWFPVLLGGWWVVAWLTDLYYVPSSFDRAASAMRVAMVGVANLVFYLAVFFLVPSDLPRLFFLFLLLVVWPAITAWRWVYAVVFSTSSLQHRILIIGQGERARSIANVLEDSPRLNYRVMGFYVDGDSAKTGSDSELDDQRIWNQAMGLRDLALQLQIHEVVVAIDHTVEKDLFHQLAECQSHGIRVSLMPDLYEQLCRKVPIEHIDPAWVLHVLQGRRVFSRFQLGLKRLLDLALGFMGLIILALALPFVALVIRLDSAGPIFYRQVRSGRAGKLFRVVKFRTMDPNAEKDGRARWAAKDDPRITRVGRFLRKSRLDELPQVLNVLNGEMSFVGPRPERPEFIGGLEQEIPFYRIRLMVKPGLTGWAQTQYGYGNTTDDALVKLQYDFYYLRNWSLWLDLYIIVRTFWVVFKLTGT